MGWSSQAQIAQLVIIEGPNDGLFVYNGTPAAGNLVASITSGPGTEQFGNSYQTGITSYQPATNFAQVFNGGITFGSLAAGSLVTVDGLIQFADAVTGTSQPSISVVSPGTSVGGLVQLNLFGESHDGTRPAQVSVSAVAGVPATSALFEVDGTAAIRPASGISSTGFDVEGSTNGAGQLAFIKNSPQVNGDHTLTVNQTGTGNDNTVAGNFTSNSDLSSTVYISGQATQRGVLKISHNPGSASGLDATASLLALDTGSTAGTACQGIALISTTPTTGNLLLLRNNTLDNFVVKGSGRVAIGVAIGHTPTGMLEIQQQDTSTVGLAMTAIAAGTDMVNLKDSGGSQRFQIGNAGNLTVRATAFFTSPVMFGSTSSDTGGGGGGTLMIAHNTDPTTNPASGRILLYCDSSGNLLARTQAGNVRTVAAV